VSGIGLGKTEIANYTSKKKDAKVTNINKI